MNETTPENDIAYPEDQSRCFVDGLSCHSHQLSVRSMNFGQLWRTPEIMEVTYQAYLPKDFITGFLKGELAAYKMDAIEYPDFENPFENILREQSWPSIEKILEDTPLFILVLEQFGHEILLQWFGDQPLQNKDSFVINTIEWVDIASEGPCFYGAARKAGVPVKFQDE